MMDIKTGTKTWTEQTGNRTPMQGDGKQIMSATDRKRVLGDQDLGSYLNKIADPNYVEPQKIRRVGNNKMGKEAFLKLFLAQLKNQDPTTPLESHELAAQLAQFSSIEKLDEINSGIETMNRAQAPAQNFDSLGMIGKHIEGDASKIIRKSPNESHDVKFTLLGEAVNGTISIRNGRGQEIRKMEMAALKKGVNNLNWNGKLENGAPAPVGDYSVVIEAKNSNGQKVAAQTSFQGQVTGVNFTAEGPMLLVGQTKVRMSDITSISDPGLMKKSQEGVNNIKDVKNLKAEHGEQATLDLASKMSGSLEDMNMNQELVSKVERELSGPPEEGTGLPEPGKEVK